MRERRYAGTSTNGFETELRVIFYDQGPLEGALKLEVGLHQGRDHPRGVLLGPEAAKDLRKWLDQRP